MTHAIMDLSISYKYYLKFRFSSLHYPPTSLSQNWMGEGKKAGIILE